VNADLICILFLVGVALVGIGVVAFLRWTLGMSDEELRKSDPRRQWNKANKWGPK
jgi:hypothetical protein